MMATAEQLRIASFGQGSSLRPYSARRSNSPLRAIEREMYRSRSNSQYIRRVQRLESLIEDTKDLLRTAPNWDSYGAQPPNISAVNAALEFLISEHSNLLPVRTLPSAEGGVALSFAAGDKRALVEFLNIGSVDVITRNPKATFSKIVMWRKSA